MTKSGLDLDSATTSPKEGQQLTFNLLDRPSKTQMASTKPQCGSDGLQWKMSYQNYVKGGKEYVSAYLDLIDAKNMPFGWCKEVSLQFRIVEPNGNTLSLKTNELTEAFSFLDEGWGFKDFVCADTLRKSSALAGDKFQVEVTIEVLETRPIAKGRVTKKRHWYCWCY
jgi:hypothetical protein